MTAACALSLAGCQTTVRSSDCDGVQMIPVTAAGAVKLASDADLRATGQGVAAHNSFWAGRGCW